ncbi:MAG: motility associated factor glycosyltransferase family protein [Treponemataceae bacterium]
MKSIFLKNNLELFAKRFPELFEQFKLKYGTFDDDRIIENIMTTHDIEITTGKAGNITMLHQKKALHSMYNPINEAKKIVQAAHDKEFSCGIFFSIGLGYAAHEFAKEYPQKKLIIIEPESDFFLVALAFFDFSTILNHAICILFVNAPPQTIISILEKIGLNECFCFKEKNQMQHADLFFTQLDNLITRNTQKKSINANTLEKFSKLWLKNTCKNLKKAINCDSIQRYKEKTNLPVCVIAAGPTLDESLEFLSELKKRFIIVCVDTALKALLKQGVEPHFIVVSDPQYWNYCHLLGLKAPSSILITELAAYPAIFHFDCKEIILCSSLYPLGNFIETKLSPYGKIGAGGSVSTTAWDFAHFIGSKEIFLVALDLGFPENKTHYKGSTFEEKNHLMSYRLFPVEINSVQSLYGASAFLSTDYEGNAILTDSRMSLYAWWFESRAAAYPDITVSSISTKSLKINGIQTTSIKNLLNRPNQEQKIKDFIDTKNNISFEKKKDFLNAINEAKTALQEINFIAQKGIMLANEFIQLEKRTKDKKINNRQNEIIEALKKIDTSILNSNGKELASLVFPNEKQLAKLTNQAQTTIEKSLIIYTELEKSVLLHITQIEKALAEICL